MNCILNKQKNRCSQFIQNCDLTLPLLYCTPEMIRNVSMNIHVQAILRSWSRWRQPKPNKCLAFLCGTLNRWAVYLWDSGDHTEKQGTHFVNVNIFIAVKKGTHPEIHKVSNPKIVYLRAPQNKQRMEQVSVLPDELIQSFVAKLELNLVSIYPFIRLLLQPTTDSFSGKNTSFQSGSQIKLNRRYANIQDGPLINYYLKHI